MMQMWLTVIFLAIRWIVRFATFGAAGFIHRRTQERNVAKTAANRLMKSMNNLEKLLSFLEGEGAAEIPEVTKIALVNTNIRNLDSNFTR